MDFMTGDLMYKNLNESGAFFDERKRTAFLKEKAPVRYCRPGRAWVVFDVLS
jgi:hypothetical protein